MSEAFHLPSFSWRGCSQEFLAEALNWLGVWKHHWWCTMKHFNTQWFTYYRPGKITLKLIRWQWKKKIDCWPFILANNTLDWILGFCIGGLAKNKKLSAWSPYTSFRIKVRGYYFFLDFFKKDFYFDKRVIIYCVLFTINITFYRSFISSVLHIWFLVSGPGSCYIFYFIFFNHYGISSSWRSNQKNISHILLTHVL